MKATVAFTIRVPAATAKRIKRSAAERGWTFTAWIRQAVLLAAEYNPDLVRGRIYPETTEQAGVGK